MNQRDIDFASNDYLGLTRHQGIIEAACQAIRRYGTGAAASRAVTGTLQIHLDLESALATWLSQPAALVTSTGYHANLAAMTTLGLADAPIILDSHAHASLVDGARLSRKQVWYADHNDVGHVEELLRAHGRAGALVVVESVYSVLGDTAPLAALAALCERYRALLAVDEAHALGTTGDSGDSLGVGLVAAAGLAGLPHVVVTGTLSKAFAAQGGVLAGSYGAIAALREARPFVYDTGLAPGAAGAALAVCELLRTDPTHGHNLRANITRLQAIFGGEATPIFSVAEQVPGQAQARVEWCAEHGIRVAHFRPQSSPDRRARIRLTAHATTTVSDWAYVTPLFSHLT